MENNTVTISLERYERLIATEARCNVLENHTIRSEYSIQREDIANILGFELPKKVKEDE